MTTAHDNPYLGHPSSRMTMLCGELVDLSVVEREDPAFCPEVT